MTSTVDVWTPPGGMDIQALRAGRWWDAVRVTEPVGALALGALGDDSGAVIADLYGRSLYWLVAPGAAADWRLPHVSVLGAKAHEVTYVGVPPAGCVRGPGVHWRVPYVPGRYLTEPDRLHRALLSALAHVQVCRGCDKPTTERARRRGAWRERSRPHRLRLPAVCTGVPCAARGGAEPVSTADAAHVEVQRLTLDQIQGWYCALCGARLFADRSLGLFELTFGRTTETVELWACAPSCEAARQARAKRPS
ncbi:hypothetical protein [Streptomyces sp. XD-27]|uniref:hypothetical protein n=1 Tax=Streptomyces sp. XD-27 TaxID=3062779 RepID=UPI0026F44E6C|nr:hypothetical protein [Streptomyces sp. XD-27]WKX70868.1 hypothetical protein Q3Y56_14005 [Streptomyces sp. XD-27]